MLSSEAIAHTCHDEANRCSNTPLGVGLTFAGSLLEQVMCPSTPSQQRNSPPAASSVNDPAAGDPITGMFIPQQESSPPSVIPQLKLSPLVTAWKRPGGG